MRDRRGSTSLLSSSCFGMAAQAAHLAVRFVVTPVLIADLGYEAFGFWGVLFALLGLSGVHRMGFAGPAVARVASAAAQGDDASVRAALHTSGSLALGFALLVGPLLWWGSPGLVDLLRVSDELRGVAILTLRMTSVTTLIALVFGGFQNALEARQRYGRIRAVEVGAAVCEALVAIGLVRLGVGPLSLPIAYAFRLIGPLPVLAWMARREFPTVWAVPGPLHRASVVPLLRFGGALQILGMVHIGASSFDRFAISQVLSMVAVGQLEVARRLLQMAIQFPMQALAPLAPAAAALAVQDDGPVRTTKLLRRGTRAIGLLSAFPLAFMIVAGEPLLHAWLGRPDPRAAAALQWLCVGSFFHLATGPTTSILRGLSRSRREMEFALSWLALGLVLVPFLSLRDGIRGAALGYALAQAITALVFLVRVWPSLGGSARQLGGDLLRPLCAVALPALLVQVSRWALPDSATRVSTFAFVAFAGISAGAFSLVLGWRWVFEEEDRRRVRQWIRRLRPVPLPRLEATT